MQSAWAEVRRVSRWVVRRPVTGYSVAENSVRRTYVEFARRWHGYRGWRGASWRPPSVSIWTGHGFGETPKIQACQKLLDRLEAAGLVELCPRCG